MYRILDSPEKKKAPDGKRVDVSSNEETEMPLAATDDTVPSLPNGQSNPPAKDGPGLSQDIAPSGKEDPTLSVKLLDKPASDIAKIRAAILEPIELTNSTPESFLDFIERNGPAILPAKISGEKATEPYYFTAEETEAIKLALQIEKEELLQQRLEKLSALCQMFERYLLKGLVVPNGCKIKFYSLGCGRDGALDAYAIQLAAKRQHVQTEAICVDDNSANARHGSDQSDVDESAEQWKRLAGSGLVDEKAAQFIEIPAQQIDFSKEADSKNPLLVVVRNVSPGALHKILYQVGLRLFPVMEKLRNSGSDSRFMVTSDETIDHHWNDFIIYRGMGGYIEREQLGIPERGPLDEAAQKIKFKGGSLSLKYLGRQFQRNPTPTSDYLGWNDEYVTVVGYK